MFLRKLFLLIACFGWTYLDVSAQNFDPPLRLEFDMEENKYPMNMELLGKNGLVLLFQKAAKEETKWTICHYDTNFQLLKTRAVPFEGKTTVCATASDENFFYAILQEEKNTKANLINTYILLYSAETKKIDVFSFYHAEKEKIMSIAYYGNIFVYHTYNSKSEENVYVFHRQSLTVADLYPEKTGSHEFQDMYRDSISQRLWLVSKFYEAKKQASVRLTQLDAEGNVLQEFVIESDGKYVINSCKIISSQDDKLLLVGNYLHNEGSKSSTRNNNNGIFTATVKDGHAEQMRFFDYTNLDNWYVINKRSLSNCYDILYFVAQNDSFLIMASDFYAPEYQHYSDPYAVGGGLYPSTVNSKLIGFRYQTACMFTFDSEGNLLWYNPLNYSGLLLKSVRPLLSGYIDPETNNVLYLFGFNNKLFSLIYHQMEIVQSIKTITIQSSSRFETIDSGEKARYQHWYGSYFIGSAYQRTSKKYGSNSRRNSKYVFGVNKLVYE